MPLQWGHERAKGYQVTTLTSWVDSDGSTIIFQSSDKDAIAQELRKINVRYEYREPLEAPSGSSADEIMEIFSDIIAEFGKNENYTTVDIAQLHPSDSPEARELAAAARAKFLNEHTHDDDEVRYFVQGSGIFYLHIDGKVHAVLCTAGDLLDVPANTTHWFDMGTRPDFTAVRFFKVDDGWIGDFTGSDISSRFPTYDELIASVPA